MNRLTLANLMVCILLSVSGCKNERGFSVIITSDLHYDTTQLRQTIMDSVVNIFNDLADDKQDLPGVSFPLKSVFVLGDITESGKACEWELFDNDFGVHRRGKITLPVYETFGNHDGNINGVVRQGIASRNLLRRNIGSISENGLFYSVDIRRYHFVFLGIYPGNEWDADCEWCKYFKESFREPQHSLEFLEKDLIENVGQSGKPVVLLFHYGWDDFSRLWWTETEQEELYSVIENYNIIGIFHGHDHLVEHYKWKGISVWSAGSPQSGSRTGNFLILNADRSNINLFKFQNGKVTGILDNETNQ